MFCMKCEEFMGQLGKSGVTAYQFAELFNMNPNSVTKGRFGGSKQIDFTRNKG